MAPDVTVPPAEVGDASVVLTTMAAATGPLVAADGAAEFAFVALSSLSSSFALVSDVVLAVVGVSVETTAGFMLPGTAAASDPVGSGCGVGLSEEAELSAELAVAVVALLVGPVGELAAAGVVVAELVFAACCLPKLRPRPAALPFAACPVAFPATVFTPALPLWDEVVAAVVVVVVVVVVAVLAVLAAGCGAASLPSVRSAFVGAEF